MPAPDLRRLLHAAQAAEQRGDHATYCAAWGRIDKVLDAMLEAKPETEGDLRWTKPTSSSSRT